MLKKVWDRKTSHTDHIPAIPLAVFEEPTVGKYLHRLQKRVGRIWKIDSE
jgi:hypothetical protein